MKTLILTFLLCITPLISKAQEPQLQWSKNVGGVANDIGHSVAVDALGNIYTIGEFRGTADFDPGSDAFSLTAGGVFSIFITKLDPAGNFIWAKQIHASAIHAHFSITLDESANLYITGNFQDTVDFDPNEGIFKLAATYNTDDMFFLKLDSSGNFIWAKNIGGISKYESTQSITVDKTGNVYITGSCEGNTDFDPSPATFYLSSAGSEDIFVLKLDTFGNFIWAKRMGGQLDDYGYSIVVDALSNVYIAGYFTSKADFDPGERTLFLTSKGVHDAFITKLDSSGNLVWVKQVGGTKQDVAQAITLDFNGDLYVSGYFEDKVDFDSGKDIFNLTSIINDDIFVLKLDSSGSFIWAKRIGDTADINQRKIVVDSELNIYITGFFQGTLDFDPSTQISNLTSEGNYDIFILKLDRFGNFVWAKQMGSLQDDIGLFVTLDKFDNIYCTGSFQETINCGTSSNSYKLTSAGERDVFVMKLTQTPNDVYEAGENASPFHVYPNPGSGAVTLHFGKQLANGTLKLVNTLGQTVLQQIEINASSQNIDVAGVENGVYFVEVNDGVNISRMKFVKE